MSNNILISAIARSGFIYFISRADSEGHTKVGWTTNPIQRWRAIQTGQNVSLKWRGHIRGFLGSEKAFHGIFRHRERGEWFSPCPIMQQLFDCFEFAASGSRRNKCGAIIITDQMQQAETWFQSWIEDLIRHGEYNYDDPDSSDGLVEPPLLRLLQDHLYLCRAVPPLRAARPGGTFLLATYPYRNPKYRLPHEPLP
jgi:hypothetical protein